MIGSQKTKMLVITSFSFAYTISHFIVRGVGILGESSSLASDSPLVAFKEANCRIIL